jgi:hypothetical protein
MAAAAALPSPPPIDGLFVIIHMLFICDPFASRFTFFSPLGML